MFVFILSLIGMINIHFIIQLVFRLLVLSHLFFFHVSSVICRTLLNKDVIEPRGQWPLSKTFNNVFLFKLFILNLWSILIQLFSKDFNVFMGCLLRIVSFCFLSSMIPASWHAMPTCTWFMPLHGPLAKWFGTSLYIWKKNR